MIDEEEVKEQYGEGIAILLSGILFGLFHGNLNQFAYAFVLGCFYGFIYVRTRNVIYTILMHMLTNFMGPILGMYIMEKTGYLEYASAVSSASTQEEIMNLTMTNISGIAIFMSYAMLLVILVIAGIILLIIKRKKFYINHTSNELQKGQSFSTVALNAGMLLFGIFWIVQIIVQLLR